MRDGARPPAAARSLSGIVVLERADRLGVSACGSLLAELGATVLQVEGGAYDIGLTEAARERAARLARHGKIKVDLAGRALDSAWLRLVERADVVLLGDLGPEDRALVERERGRRIMCALSAFGADALPGTGRAGETVVQAAGGLIAATGMRGGPPERPNVPLLEMLAALNAATATLAVLRSGGRAFLDIATIDAAVAILTTYASTVADGRPDGYRLGCGHHLCSPWNVYRAADGWIQLCSTTDEQWRTVLRVIGHDDLSGDAAFADSRARLANAGAVDALIGDWAAGRSAADAVARLQGAGLPVGLVRRVFDLARDAEAARAEPSVSDEDPRPRSFLTPDRLPPASPDSAHDLDALLDDLGPRSAKPTSTLAKPLEGLRVVEIGPYTAGPLGGRYLADLGAEVIKVEPPGGEISRSWPPLFGDHGGYFAICNAGKATVVLDLKSAPDRARFVELVREADVLLENLRPGALGKLGLGPADLRQVAPRLVYVSISGFGRDAGSRPALDSVVQAEAGLMWLVGGGERPQRVGVSVADQAAAHAAPLLILAALRACDATGESQDVDLAMQDVLSWMIGLAWPDGRPVLAPWATLAVANGWVLARGEDPAVASVVAWIGDLDRDDAVRRLAAVGIEAVAVQEPGEAFAHEAVGRRGLVQHIGVGEGASVPILSSPHRIGAGPLPAGPLPGPAGQDTARLLADLPA